MNPIPEDYYASEASYNGSDVEESQHLHFQDPTSVSDDNLQDSSSKENSPPGPDIGAETQEALIEFQEMFAHTPPWLRAERAGMHPISPWRETCDIPPSQRPPPSRRQQKETSSMSSASSPSPSPSHRLASALLDPADHLPQAPSTPSPTAAHDATSSPQPLHLHPAMTPVNFCTRDYPRPDPRTPLGTLYEADRADHDLMEERREMVDVACMTDIQGPIAAVLHHRDAECQTEPQDEIILEWLDKTVVEKELREGRDARLKEYVMRFRHSVAAGSVDHRRAFMPQKQPSAPGPLLQKTSHSTRAEFARVTKIKAKEKIQSWYQDGAALDSQTDSQTWLNGTLLANHTGPGPKSLTATPANAHVVPTRMTPTVTLSSEPSTPTRASESSTAVASSPFSVWGMDPGMDASPSRFTENLAQLRVVCGTARLSPRDLSFADLDALLEYQTKLNALLTEDLVVTHAKLYALEDKFKAYSIYYGFSIDH